MDSHLFEVTAPRRWRFPFLLRTKGTPAIVAFFGVLFAVLGSSIVKGKLAPYLTLTRVGIALDNLINLLPPREILNGMPSTKI